KVSVQYRRLRSAHEPKTSRISSAVASPAPLMRPTRTAEAPSDASNGPVTDRAPSYTMSAARLTTPKPTTVRHGDQESRPILDWLAAVRSVRPQFVQQKR